MRKFIIALILVLFSFNAYAAVDFFNRTSLTGGGTGALDALDVTNDAIDNGDKALVCSTGDCYLYNFNSSSGATESSPDVIKPDNDSGVGYTGNGRWILLDIQADQFEAATGVSIDEFSSDGTLGGNSDTAVPTEKAVKTYSDTKVVDTDFPGFLIRAQIDHADDDTITINPGVYHHQGTTEQFVYWDSAISFDVGSGGSNTSSDALGASEWHYIYLDDSAIVTQGAALLDADCFLNDTTAPTWDATRHGWYANTKDRCIGAFYSDADSDIVEFFSNGNTVFFAGMMAGGQTSVDDFDYTNIDVDTTWDDVYLPIPAFARMAHVDFHSSYVSDATSAYMSWRTNGQTESTGHTLYIVYLDHYTFSYKSTPVITDSSRIIEVKASVSGAHDMDVHVLAWCYPIGM